MEYIETVIFFIEIIGTIAFSASGAMLGVRKGMDIFGVIVLGVVTAVGGGMFRDMILGNVPSSLLNPVYAGTAALTAAALFLVLYLHRDKPTGRFRTAYDRVIMIMDAIGLGVFSVIGVSVGIRNGYADETFLLTFLGTITGVGGGLLRDMMAQEPPYILTKHIYALASIAGAVVYIYLNRYLGEMQALVTAPLIVVTIRMLAAHFRWNLPRIPR